MLLRANAAIFSTMSQRPQRGHVENGDWNKRRMTFSCHPHHLLPLFFLHERELPIFPDSRVLLIIQWIDENCWEMWCALSVLFFLEQHEADRFWRCSLRTNHWLQWSCSFNIRLCQLLAARLNTEHTDQNCVTWKVPFTKFCYCQTVII